LYVKETAMKVCPTFLLFAAVLCGCGAVAEEPAIGQPSADAAPAQTDGAQSNAVQAGGPSDKLVDIGARTAGTDWPGFLGPNRNSTSPEKGIDPKLWKGDGPRVVWSRKLNDSYTIGSIAKGRYFQYDREGDNAVLHCWNAATGKDIWQFKHKVRYEDLYGYGGGPRAAPLVDGNRVYIFGVAGMLHCVRADTGKLVWKVDTTREFGVIQNFFGAGSSPIVEGDLLLNIIGGSPPAARKIPPGQLDRVTGNGSGIVAFNKFTGKVEYKITNELAGYASLQITTIGKRRYGFAFCRGGLVAFHPQTGVVDFEYPWRAKILESVNAANPVVVGNEVLISETYGKGASVLAVKPGGYDIVWKDDDRKREKSLETHWNTAVVHNGYIYASSGRHTENAELRCVEWKTGKVKWSKPGLSRSSLLLVDGYLICLTEYGTLQLLRPNPSEYDLVAEITLRDTSVKPAFPGFNPPAMLKYPAWAAPVLSHGLLYVRGASRVVCLEVIPEKK